MIGCIGEKARLALRRRRSQGSGALGCAVEDLDLAGLEGTQKGGDDLGVETRTGQPGDRLDREVRFSRASIQPTETHSPD